MVLYLLRSLVVDSAGVVLLFLTLGIKLVQMSTCRRLTVIVGVVLLVLVIGLIFDLDDFIALSYNWKSLIWITLLRQTPLSTWDIKSLLCLFLRHPNTFLNLFQLFLECDFIISFRVHLIFIFLTLNDLLIIWATFDRWVKYCMVPVTMMWLCVNAFTLNVRSLSSTELIIKPWLFLFQLQTFELMAFDIQLGENSLAEFAPTYVLRVVSPNGDSVKEATAAGFSCVR